MDLAALTSIIPIICGSTTIVTFVLYRRQQRISKMAEAFEKEVDALRNTVGIMRQPYRCENIRLCFCRQLEARML